MNDQRGSVEKYSSIEEAKALLAERANTERIRYKDIYNLNYMEFSNYNLIIDGTYCDPDTMADIIIEEAKEFYANPGNTTKRLVSPKCLIFKDFNEENDKSRLDNMIKSLKNVKRIKDKIINVKKQDGRFRVIEDFDLAESALLADVSYVQIEIVEE